MEELKAWLKVDPLTAEQAAYLALDAVPNPGSKPPIGFHALLAQIHMHLQFGNIPALRAPTGPWDGSFATLFDPKVHALSSALIYQDKLAKWFEDNGYLSKFFHLPAAEWASPDESLIERWPWGSHTTANLEHLAAAAGKFWRHYDPQDHTTAPLNEDVVQWLEARGVSGRIAAAMATILRADNLPTGPRT